MRIAAIKTSIVKLFIKIVKEVGSGLNDNGRQLENLFKRDDYNILLVEHKGRLSRFGTHYLDVLLQRLEIKLEIVNIDALMTVVFNDPSIKPIIINGKPLKSINQFYNKQIAYYKSCLPTGCQTTKRIENIIRNRNNKENLRELLRKSFQKQDKREHHKQ